MNLKEVRTQFIETSGRYDLVLDTEEYLDNGADFYIQAGAKMLDQLDDSGAEAGTVFVTAKVSDYYKFIPQLRVVEEVWAYDNQVRKQLTECDRDELRYFFPNKIISNSTGYPAIYFPGSFKIGNVDSNDNVPEFMVRLSGDHSVPNGIIFPPTDRALTLEIIGKFFSDPLEKCGDENFWSVNYPILLLWAALYHLEVTYRNTQGATDWLNAIHLKLQGISFDAVDQAGINVKQMEG